MPVATAFRGVVEASEAELVRRIASSDGLPLRPGARSSARAHLCSTLSALGGPALLHEVRRGAGSFSDLVERARRGGLSAALSWQPNLTRHLEAVCEQWISHLVGISEDAKEDLCDGVDETLGLVAIAPGLSDRHDGGRSVTGVTLSDGRRFAYKPRSLAPEHLFTRFSSWLARHHPELRLDRPRLRVRARHGWMEWVEPRGCRNPEDVRLFFHRSGAYLLALHALGVVDCHAENVIARGDEPVLLDVETLGHPHTIGHRNEGVLRTGLLPYWKRVGGRWVGLGGLGASGALFGRPNLPELDGHRASAYEHVDAIIAGFLKAGHALLTRREEVFSPRGELAQLHGVRARRLLRPTQFYGELLESLVAPRDEVGDSGVLRPILARRLREAPRPPGVRSRKLLGPLIDLEVEALLRLDVPRFSMALGSTTLRSLDGDIRHFTGRPASEMIRERIESLSPDHLDEQVELIRAALTLDRLYDARGGDEPTWRKGSCGAGRRPYLFTPSREAD